MVKYEAMHFEEEFENIYLKYSDKIFRYLFFKTNDAYLSEDITSEVFTRLWKNRQEFKRDYVGALLYKIAGNLLIDHFRKMKNNKKLSLEKITEAGFEPSYDEDLVEKIHKSQEVQKLNKALNLLPKNLKDVAILRFIEGLSAKEAAEILNISEINVRVLQHRALLKLKEIYKNGK